MALELPIENFIVSKLQENFPNIDVRHGTAFRDMLISPQSIIMQPYRDQVNILKRNLSLQNYSLMLEEEMDMLVANMFVERRQGAAATGTIRIYVTEPQDLQITVDAIFSTREGLVFNPSRDYFIAAEDIELNSDGLFYYYDITVEASEDGTAYNIPEDVVIYASNIPDGIIKVNNPSPFFQGVDSDTNEELYARAKDAISVRDLVSKKSIMSTLTEQIIGIKEIFVIGFGDPEMMRDLAEFTLATADVVPITSTGSIDNSDIPGILTDTTINFYDNYVSPGHSLIIMDGLDIGQYLITHVTEDTLKVDRQFAETRSGVQYRVGGISVPEQLHVGGKVDIYLNTTGYTSLSEVIENAPEIMRINTTYRTGELRTGESRIYDLKTSFIVRDVTLNDQIVIVNGSYQGTYKISSIERDWVDITDQDDNPINISKGEDGVWYYIIREYYENEEVWSLPIINFDSVTAIDPITRETLATLEEGTDYEIVVNDPDVRYSVDDDFVIRLIETNPASPDYYIGSTIEFLYNTDPTVITSQEYVDNENNRVLTASLLVKSAIPSFVDIDLIYKGEIEETQLEAAIRHFVSEIRFDDALKASDIIQFTQFFNVTYVQASDISVKMTCYTKEIDGSTTVQESTDYIKIERTSKFVPRAITLTKSAEQFEVRPS